MLELKENSGNPGMENTRHHSSGTPSGAAGLSLAELPVGATATIIKVMPGLRGRQKFADVGLVAGTELLMEAHAPFGGLLRVKVMETSMALHRDDAANIMLTRGEQSK